MSANECECVYIHIEPYPGFDFIRDMMFTCKPGNSYSCIHDSNSIHVSDHMSSCVLIFHQVFTCHSIQVSMPVLQVAYPGVSKLGHGLIKFSETRIMFITHNCTKPAHNQDTSVHVNAPYVTVVEVI